MGQAKNWSREETEQLKEWWGYKTIPQIAKLLGRTETAIIVKYKRLGLGAPTSAGELLTGRATAETLGVDIHTITDYWIPKLGLKAKKKAFRGIKKMWMIHIDDLMKFLKANQDKWDSRRVELYSLGSEPIWLQEKRKQDRTNTMKTGKKWTPLEDAKAINLFKQGFNYVEIGKELNRTREAVEHRMSRLDIWGTGKYISPKEKAIKKAENERKALIRKFERLLLTRRNELAFDGYWQKEMCMNWDDVRGCIAGETDCDSCTSFRRIKPQYCKRCGKTFFERKENLICSSCRMQRKQQSQRKYATLHGKRI
nr:hypothetical protein [uncultured Aminipila sp.]